MFVSRSILAGVALAAAAACIARAQDTTKGVRIGLRYDPSTKPGVLVLPIPGSAGDSIRAILERDLDYSDRLSVIRLTGGEGVLPTDRTPAGAPVPMNYPLFARLGAAAILQITPTAGRGLHLALHDVGRAQVASVDEFTLAPGDNSRDWRLSVHRLADTVESWITGRSGIAGTRVAFVRDHAVRLIDSDGTDEVGVPVIAPAMSPSWSPDGRLLVYNTFGPESRIVLNDLQTGKVRDFGAQRNTTNVTPVFTPDGASIAFSLSTENGADLYIAPLDGNGFPRRISVGRGSVNVQPSFSPDGNQLAFMSDRSGHPEVYIMDADGTNADIFTAFDFGDQNYRASPDWSPDGRQVAFQSRIDDRFQIFTMSLRDRQPRQLTSEGENEDPAWAPDGRHLVFSSTRSGTRQLWILDTESGRLRQLTQLGNAQLPAWSPKLTAR